MKPTTKLLLRVPAIILAVLALTACPSDSSEDYLNVSTNQLTLTSAGKGQLTISSNVSWSITNKPMWLNCSATSGKGDMLLMLTAENNPNKEERIGTLTVKSSAANIETNVTIVQPGAGQVTVDDQITVSPTSIVFAADPDSRSVTVSANGSWTMAAPVYGAEASGWLALSINSSVIYSDATKAVTIEAEKNTATTERTATITFTCGTATAVVMVKQQPGGETYSLDVNTTNISFNSSAASSETFTLTSNTSWTVTSSEAWLTVTPTSGSNDRTITASATENTLKDARTAVITIAGEGVQTKTVNVTQPGTGAYLTLDYSRLNFDSSRADSKTFNIDSNAQWIVTTSASWLTVSPTSGSGNATISVEVADNNDAAPRTATITVSGEGITRTVSVQQSGNSLQVSPQELSFKWEGEEKSFTITSEGSWVVSGAPSWCNLSQTSGSGNATISVTAAANNSSSDRTATLTVKSGSISHSVTLTQNGQKVPQEGDQNLPDHSRSSK